MRAPKKVATKKATKATKATRKVKTDVVYVTLGTKGVTTVLGTLPESVSIGEKFVHVWTGFKGSGISARSMCDTHAKGKAQGAPMACYDSGCYVSKRGDSVVTMPLTLALSKKHIKRVKFVVTPAKGKEFAATGYVRANWDAATRIPQYVAFDTADIKSGRVETTKINDAGARNANLMAKLAIA